MGAAAAASALRTRVDVRFVGAFSFFSASLSSCSSAARARSSFLGVVARGAAREEEVGLGPALGLEPPVGLPPELVVRAVAFRPEAAAREDL